MKLFFHGDRIRKLRIVTQPTFVLKISRLRLPRGISLE